MNLKPAAGASRQLNAHEPATAKAAAQNSSKTAGKVRGRPFKKGQSGNPGGRPKTDQELRESMRDLSPRCAERLAKLIGSKNERTALGAIALAFERGYGKALQSMDLNATLSFADEAEAFIRALNAERAAR